jgi:hypothetical protein
VRKGLSFQETVMKSAQRNVSTLPAGAGPRGASGVGADDTCGRALQRVQAKQDIVAQLVAGRINLLDAATRFRAASQPVAEWHGGAFRARPEENADEHVCRTLIGWAYLALCEYPERAEAVSNRLETDLQALLDRHGCICLPG